MKPKMDEDIAKIILSAWEDGCPVAAHDEAVAAKMAAIARRRWNSYSRRKNNVPDSIEHRIDDLARGLAERFTEGGLSLAGAAISDYRWLSEQLADVLAKNS